MSSQEKLRNVKCPTICTNINIFILLGIFSIGITQIQKNSVFSESNIFLQSVNLCVNIEVNLYLIDKISVVKME